MNAIETGLYSALSGDTALTGELGSTAIYNRHAPQGTDRPYVIFFHAGGGHENINPSDMQNHLYLAKAVTDTPLAAGTIDGLMTTALHKQILTVDGYTNFWTAREQEVQITETAANGTIIDHTGAYYRIRIDS